MTCEKRKTHNSSTSNFLWLFWMCFFVGRVGSTPHQGFQSSPGWHYIFDTRSGTNPIHLLQRVDPNYTLRWSFLNLPSSLKLTAKTHRKWMVGRPSFPFGHLFFHRHPLHPKETPRKPQTHRLRIFFAPPPWKAHVHDTSIIFEGVGRRLRATFRWEGHERLVPWGGRSDLFKVNFHDLPLR